MTEPAAESHSKSRRLVLAAAAFCAIAVVAVLAGVYGIGHLRSNPAAAACAPAVETASRIAPLARGEVAALAVAHTPFLLPDLAFKDGIGRGHTLNDWRGRVVLLNLWATWCVPCRKEMPALDTLQADLGGAKFDVVAVNIDTRDPEKPVNWLKEAGISRLPYFSDSQARVFQELKLIGRAVGMPTSVLIDTRGCEIATIAGPAAWASDDGLALIAAAVQDQAKS